MCTFLCKVHCFIDLNCLNCSLCTVPCNVHCHSESHYLNCSLCTAPQVHYHIEWHCPLQNETSSALRWQVHWSSVLCSGKPIHQDQSARVVWWALAVIQWDHSVRLTLDSACMFVRVNRLTNLTYKKKYNGCIFSRMWDLTIQKPVFLLFFGFYSYFAFLHSISPILQSLPCE